MTKCEIRCALADTSNLEQSTRPGSTTTIMRSCDSLIKIAAGPRPSSRSGTWSSATVMPVPPAAASSVVAQAIPAAPRSPIATTTPAA